MAKVLKDRAQLYKQLYFFVSSGYTNMIQAASLVFQRFGIRRKGEWLEDLKGKIPSNEYEFLKISSETGKLDLGLKSLYTHVERMGKTKKDFIASLFFPVIEIVFGFTIFLFIVVYVVPRLANFVKQLGGELPVVSQIVFSVGNFTWEYLPFILLVTVVVIWFVARNWESIAFSIPFIRKIALWYEKILLFESLDFIYSSGANIYSAVRNIHLRLIDLSPVQKKLEAGESFTNALEDVLDPMESEILRTGETTGKLDEVFPWLTEINNDLLFSTLKKLSGSVAVLILIILGVIVFLVLLAIYLPLFKVAAMI